MKKAVIINIKKKSGYLNIGNNRSLPISGIVGIFDLDNTTQSRQMREFLRNSEKSGKTISVATALPKSIIYFDDGLRENVCFSSFTVQALYGRINGE